MTTIGHCSLEQDSNTGKWLVIGRDGVVYYRASSYADAENNATNNRSCWVGIDRPGEQDGASRVIAPVPSPLVPQASKILVDYNEKAELLAAEKWQLEQKVKMLGSATAVFSTQGFFDTAIKETQAAIERYNTEAKAFLAEEKPTGAEEKPASADSLSWILIPVAVIAALVLLYKGRK